MASFSTRLKELRTTRNLRQIDIANLLNAKERIIQAYEANDRKPPIEKFIILADYFNVSIDYLVGRSDDPRRH